MAAPLSAEDLSALQEDGVLTPDSQAGKRQSTASVQYRDTHPHQDLPDFPDEQESAAALEYIGLQPAAAQEIFNRWQSRPDPDQCPDELLDYVFGHILQLKQTSWQGYSDAEALQRLGIAPWLRSVLLDPEFKDIYKTRPLQYWLKGTFRCNYRSIETIQQSKAVQTTGNRNVPSHDDLSPT